MRCYQCHNTMREGIRVAHSTYCSEQCLADQMRSAVEIEMSALKREIDNIVDRRLAAINCVVEQLLEPRTIGKYCAARNCDKLSESMYCSNACKQYEYRARKSEIESEQRPMFA